MFLSRRRSASRSGDWVVSISFLYFLIEKEKVRREKRRSGEGMQGMREQRPGWGCDDGRHKRGSLVPGGCQGSKLRARWARSRRSAPPSYCCYCCCCCAVPKKGGKTRRNDEGERMGRGKRRGRDTNLSIKSTDTPNALAKLSNVRLRYDSRSWLYARIRISRM